MSIEKIRAVFANTATCRNWFLQLLQVKTSKRDGTTYTGREVTLSPVGTLDSFVSEISSRYNDAEKGVLQKYHDIRDYDGSTFDKTIYRLEKDNDLIATEYTVLIEAIASPDAEINPLDFKAQAYLISGSIQIENEPHVVKLISMQNPITTLKHKFLHASGTFKEITDKVISLRTSIDVVILDDVIYMLTLAGENLFNMERAYKATCESKILDIQACDIVNDFDSFCAVAKRGHNPRKFVSFNDSHLQKLRNANSRKKMSRKFGIPMIGDQFDTTQPEASDKLVKLLCDRGMIDPFDDNPMEVAGSKKWE